MAAKNEDGGGMPPCCVCPAGVDGHSNCCCFIMMDGSTIIPPPCCTAAWAAAAANSATTDNLEVSIFPPIPLFHVCFFISTPFFNTPSKLLGFMGIDGDELVVIVATSVAAVTDSEEVVRSFFTAVWGGFFRSCVEGDTLGPN